jgi:hypothetical protein
MNPVALPMCQHLLLAVTGTRAAVTSTRRRVMRTTLKTDLPADGIPVFQIIMKSMYVFSLHSDDAGTSLNLELSFLISMEVYIRLLLALLLRQVPRCLARLLVPVVWVARRLVNHHLPLGFSGGSKSISIISGAGAGAGAGASVLLPSSPPKSPPNMPPVAA